MSELPPSEQPSAAEQRLLALLLLLRTPDDGGDRSLVESIVRRARIQHAVRDLIGVVGGITGAAGNVLRLFTSRARGSGP